MSCIKGQDFRHKTVAVTFIGTGKFGFYKDCKTLASRLELSLLEFDLPLLQYNLRSILDEISVLDGKFLYLFTRYGAGAWFWKPLVIKKVLRETGASQVIYLDADCVITKDPRPYLHEALNESSIALFAQRKKLDGWISNRAARRLQLDSGKLLNSDLLTAGILLLKNDVLAWEFLEEWDRALSDPTLLLSPFFRDGTKGHLHDQSILSALYANGVFKCNLLKTGFFSKGSESISASIEDCWVYTGQLEESYPEDKLLKRLLLIWDYWSRKLYDLVKTTFLTPIHICIFRLNSVIRREFNKCR
jgi:hypothetical protein